MMARIDGEPGFDKSLTGIEGRGIRENSFAAAESNARNLRKFRYELAHYFC